MGDLEACTTAVCAAIAFTLDKLDCKSGAAAVDGLTEAVPAPVVDVAEVEEGWVAVFMFKPGGSGGTISLLFFSLLIMLTA